MNMDDQLGNAPDFDSSVSAWRQRLGLVQDVVRQELVHRQLIGHLPDPRIANPIRILDVGCGQGTQLLRLAIAGYHVTGLDPSRELLALAEEAVAAADPDVGSRVVLKLGSIDDWRTVGEDFDAVCCHGVVMYLPSLENAVLQLVEAARVGGVISVLAKNRANLAFRAGMSGDWTGTLSAFDARRYTNRLGVDNARADNPEEVIEALAAAGAETLAWYGVRLFTDHWGDMEPPPKMDRILLAEEEAGRHDPYRRLAGATHVIARRATNG